MKLSSILLAAGAVLALASSPSTSGVMARTPSPSPTEDGTDMGTLEPANDDVEETEAPSTDTASSGDANALEPEQPLQPAPESVLDALTYTDHGDEWHMKPVRVIHARVQSDTPILVEGRFVSSFGDGDLEAGYLSSLDSVNTASVEGALMYVQAEGINIKSRGDQDRCERKNGMANIIFYEILIAQTNETIAEYSDDWKVARDTFEYGPMIPMDGGRCTPVSGSGSSEKFPKACLQYNGDKGEKDLGPMVGGGIKDDDPRAPYPETYWFSFPNTCPMQEWQDKTDKCRSSSRKGLCDVGQGPDGVECTFAYDILGWVTIDDVVGITEIDNKKTGAKYKDFEEWCKASDSNIEFEGDTKTGKMKKGLNFWKKPQDKEANAERAAKVVSLYNAMMAGSFTSSQIDPEVAAAFKPLPKIASLRESNPLCQESVKSCGSGAGCQREGYSQLCKPCAEGGCVVSDMDTSLPDLSKASSETEDEAESDTGSEDDMMWSPSEDGSEAMDLEPEIGDAISEDASTDSSAVLARGSVALVASVAVAVLSALVL